jgi:predicted RNA-binding Zn-ribbon protein involved in translation (DUF1610 family)
VPPSPSPDGDFGAGVPAAAAAGTPASAETDAVAIGPKPGATGAATTQAETVARAGGAEAASPALAPTPATEPQTGLVDDCDPMAWRLPLICKDCNKQFEVPYRHFQAGVVFHCPHCHGSFVPKAPMCRAVRSAFDHFLARRREAHEDLPLLGGDDADWREQQRQDHEAFRAVLEKLAAEMRPAGKMVRKGWLASMFT